MSRLDEIEARVKAATPGPWVQTYNASNDKPADLADHSERAYAMCVRHESINEQPWVQWFGGNGDFVTHAREDVPLLLAVVKIIADRYETTGICEVCRRFDGQHEDDCELAPLLADSTEEG